MAKQMLGNNKILVSWGWDQKTKCGAFKQFASYLKAIWGHNDRIYTSQSRCGMVKN